jgi:anti-anti-sigma factor
MAFSATLEMTANNVAKITLSGELDAAVAGAFRERVEEAAQNSASRLALIMTDLTYMASVGIRVLIFAKQKMGADVDIYVVNAPQTIIGTLEMTGLQHSVTIVDKYDPVVVENL